MEFSSDGGLLLVKNIEGQIGIIKSLVSCIGDTRHQSYVDHSLEEIAAQRVYQIVAGYEDANDCNTLRDDTILKMSVGRLPMTGNPLASQSTMTRFEDTPRASELYSIAYAFADQLRLFLHSAAYVLMHSLQENMLKTKGLAAVTMKTLRERFIKIAAQVKEMKTKIKVEFPASCPQVKLLENYFLEIGQLRRFQQPNYIQKHKLIRHLQSTR